jgi:hypothetical protein
MSYLLIALFIGPLSWRLFTNYKQGVCWAVFLLTALSANPVLLTGGTLPNFNFQRLILIVLLIAALVKNKKPDAKRPVQFMGILLLYAAVNLLPLIFSIDIVMSIKGVPGVDHRDRSVLFRHQQEHRYAG